MRYLAGKNSVKDTYTINQYIVSNDNQTVNLLLLCAEVRNGEITPSQKNITIKNQNAQILDPDFVQPEGFKQTDPNTWGVDRLPMVTDENKEFWTIFKSKESLGAEKAIFETLKIMGDIPNGGSYKD